MYKIIRDVTRLPPPPGHAFGGLLGVRHRPRDEYLETSGSGHMAETIMWLSEKQGEPPTSQLAGGPKGWMLGHGPAPCVPRHMGRLSS